MSLEQVDFVAHSPDIRVKVEGIWRYLVALERGFNGRPCEMDAVLGVYRRTAVDHPVFVDLPCSLYPKFIYRLNRARGATSCQILVRSAVRP